MPDRKTTTLYHATSKARARAILRNGFKGSTGNFGVIRPGGIGPTFRDVVWLADQPLDENEGATSGALLIVEMPITAIRKYGVVEDGKPYREWAVPAALVRRLGKVRRAGAV